MKCFVWSETIVRLATKKSRRGQALIEASLMVPTLLLLFLGMTNLGFFIYAFISVGNAARVAAQYTANPSFVGNGWVACQAALRELRSIPNVNPLTTCTGDLTVNAESYTEPTFSTLASRVTVTYQTIQLFPLPFLTGKMAINRTAVIPVL